MPDAHHVPLVDLRAQYSLLAPEIDAALGSVLAGMNLVLGPELARFEAEFAAFLGVEHCVGVGSGLDALVLALRACGLEPGDEVIVPALTFVASAAAVVHAGGVPRFCDVDPMSLLIDPADAARVVTSRTRAIMPVHLFGHVAPMEAVLDLAGRRGLWVIEDAAQAHGASLGDRRAGTFGRAGCFSFYPGKNLGAYGEAGAVVTESPEVADRVRVLRNQGSRSKHEHEFVGYNSRLDELQAAVLRIKLRRLDDWNARRRELAARYDDLLADVPRVVSVRGTSARHLYVVRVPRRDAIAAALQSRGVGAGIHYPVPLHRQPALVAYRDRPLPVAEEAAAQVLSLPLFPEMTPPQQDHVVATLRAALAGADG
ncbi:MAG: DegT/DnrJ/EryC1/StrS family aminotransferase [Candidatus Sericytochromatia bacterium]|nr:DegT/DnrJ/EryC1/StrS family aminotransferase [Candidatus Tanganyikabacteria bacterium]